MITTIDIYRSLRNLLNGEFTELVEVKDIKNPTPPCFYIKPVTDNFSQTATSYGTTNYLFSIVFFSGEETLLELLNFKENLKKILQLPLQVEAYEDSECVNNIQINTLDFTLNEEDYILEASLSFEVIQKMYEKPDDSEIMEIIEINIDKK